MGETNFFNWELNNNNCQYFVKNLIKSIQKKPKNIHIRKIIFDKSDFYLLNIIFILFSFIINCL
jgi:hypothetical protein